jgi:lipoprotein-anchoring transpeptidase ErfK/SrfK
MVPQMPEIPATNLVTQPKPAIPKAALTNTPPVRIARTNAPIPLPPPVPEGGRTVQNLFEAQVVLARRGISPGCIDGSSGSQTRAAIRAFQTREKIPVTGDLDNGTKQRLFLLSSPYTYFVVTSNDLARLTPVPSSWLAKAEQTRLDYETILEWAAERGEAHIGFIKTLNPSIDWTNVTAGTSIKIPNLVRDPPSGKAAVIKISLSQKSIQAFDRDTNIIAHAPCSIAQKVEKRPVGELHVAKIALNPNYVFNPEIFPESEEARTIKRKLVIPPGPNNPVGTAWIGLDKSGYGIHGTPKPEQVGRTESHGCFRLANWNADYFVRLVWAGLPVIVEP